MRTLFLFIFCLFCTNSALFSNFEDEDFPISLEEMEPRSLEDAPQSAFLEPTPSSIVAGCVNAISGDYFESEVDLEACGIQPLVVQRSYSSKSRKWTFQHQPLLSVGTSKEGDRICAGYRDDRGSGMFYEGDIKKNLIKVPSKMYKKGLTNLSGDEISGQSHWKNSSLRYSSVLEGVKDKNMYVLKHGSLVHRYFKSEKGEKFGKFKLWKELHPSGNSINYAYDHHKLRCVEAKNKWNELLGVLKVRHSIVSLDHIWQTGLRFVHYHYDKKLLKQVTGTDTTSICYFYDTHDRLRSKKFPDGRILYIDYYEEGKAKGRVKQIGRATKEGLSQVTHTFEYHLHDNYTLVKDALGHFTKYAYDDCKRLTSITHFNQNQFPLCKDWFVWGEHDTPNSGNLMSRIFTERDNILFCNQIEYDLFGNITKERLFGNCTGKNKTAPIINTNGLPALTQCEVYTKTYLATQDGRNLPLEEHDGLKSLYFDYLPNSTFLRSRLTKANGQILKREFFAYDDNGTLIKEEWDNGTESSRENLTGATERHLKLTTPRKMLPVGLPEVIEEFYYDFEKNCYVLLKKTINHHSEKGEILQQDYYDSDNVLAYSLNFEFDPKGHLIRQTNALGEDTFFSYDENGNKLSETKEDFKKTFTYDLANRLVKEVESWEGCQFTLTHTYNTASQKTATTDAFGKTTRFEYDELGRLIKTIYPLTPNGDERLEQRILDAMGNAIQTINALGHVTKTKYTVRGQPYHIEYADGSVEEKEYSLAGLLVEEIAKNGLITKYNHDALGRVIQKEILDPEGQCLKKTTSCYDSFKLLSETDESGLTTTYHYDGAGRCIAQKCQEKVTEYAYDNLGRKNKTVEWLNENSALVTRQVHDLLGRVIEEHVEDNQGKLFKQVFFTYDKAGHRTHVTEANGATTFTSYNPRGETTLIRDALGNETRLDRDYSTVLKETHIDPLGQKTIKIFDQGHLTSEYVENNKGEIVKSESHVYDPIGQKLLNKTLIHSPNAPPKEVVTTWEYDSMGRMIHCTEANQKQTFISYNKFGQKEKILTPNGVTLFHEYDLLGRLITFKAGDSSLHYTYSYNKDDQPLLVEDLIHHSTNIRTYDIYGRLISETLDNGLKLDFSFDLLDRVTEVTLPDNTAIRYAHDAYHLRQVDRIKNDKVIYSHRYTDYDLNGEVTREELIGQAGVISYTYDLLRRPIETKAPFWHETTIFDGVNNPIQRKIVDAEGHITYDYTYDDLYQVTSDSKHHYSHDSLYNRLSKNEIAYEVNDLNQLVQQNQTHYSYDADGNLTSTENFTYKYDALGRLIQANDTVYRYDAYHRRLTKITDENMTQFLYLGDNEIGALTNDKFTELRILGLTKGLEIGASIALELQDQVFAPIHDTLGNIVALITADNKLAEAYRYTAFGEIELFSHLPLFNPWRFSSKRFDQETGFFYFGRRYYNPEIGRWITPDPAGFIDGLNLYNYVHNRPLASIDPDGRFAFLLAPVILCALEASLPYTAPLIAEYTGSATVAAVFTAAVQGLNGTGSIDPAALFSGDIAATVQQGCLIWGTVSSIPKNIIKNSASIVGKKVLNTVIERAEKKVFSWSTNFVKKEACNATKKSAKAAKDILLPKKQLKNYSLDAMSESGKIMDRKGLTLVGRSLDKHGNRVGTPFPKAFGNPASKNIQGQFHLDDILTHPNGRVMIGKKGDLKIYAPDGRGALFLDGSFKHFLNY